MATAMDGWSRKEKLYILQGLNNLDFDKMETKIPTRTRQEIKNAVLHMVNGLADAPRAKRVPILKLQHAVSIPSDDPNKQRLKTQIVRLLPNFNDVPPTQCVMNIDVRELFEQIANAIEGKPVVADAAIMEILHVIIEEVSELCGGYISPELSDFIARINSSAIPMPPSAARKEQQRSDPEGKHARAKTIIPPIYTTANTKIPPMYTSGNTNNPPIYTTANTNIPPMYPPENTNIPPMYPPENTNIPPMYPLANTNIPPMYTPGNTNNPPIYTTANTNIPPMYPLANTNIPSMYSPANTNIPPMYSPANTNIPPMYSPANTNIPPMYSPANTNIPSMCSPANTNIPPMYVRNIQPATCEFEPMPVTCQYEPVYAPANYNYNPIHAPPKIIYNPAYPPAMGNYSAIYAPPMYNIITPRNANCVPAPCVYDTLCVNTQGLFEPSMVPARPPRHELPSRSGAHHAGPKGQYCHGMNKNGQ